jgi:hypothetical protein
MIRSMPGTFPGGVEASDVGAGDLDRLVRAVDDLVTVYCEPPSTSICAADADLVTAAQIAARLMRRRILTSLGGGTVRSRGERSV